MVHELRPGSVRKEGVVFNPMSLECIPACTAGPILTHFIQQMQVMVLICTLKHEFENISPVGPRILKSYFLCKLLIYRKLDLGAIDEA